MKQFSRILVILVLFALVPFTWAAQQVIQQFFRSTDPVFSIAVTSTASAATALPGNGRQLRLVNHGPNDCWVATGGSGIVATVAGATPNQTSTPVLAGSDVVLSLGETDGYISAITKASQTATLDVQRGDGG